MGNCKNGFTVGCSSRHQCSMSKTLSCFLSLAVLAQSPSATHAGWGTTSSSGSGKYGMSKQRDWWYSSNKVSIQYDGCVMGYVSNQDDMGCMANDSGDGTYYWYKMANCRRAQVAYSIYSGGSCSSGDFKESFVTKSGISEFAYTLGTYGKNSPINSDDVADLPVCESDGNGYYLGVGCSSTGRFTIDRFTDSYCSVYYETYDSLSNLNYAMKSLARCYQCYNSNYDDSIDSSSCAYLLTSSGGCSSTESEYCTTNKFVKNQGSALSFSVSNPFSTGDAMAMTFANKVKYGLGSGMLFCSAAMFMGILFTNRRKRRALMHRKFRHGDKKSPGRSKRSKSHSSRAESTKPERSHRRSKSRESTVGVLT